MAKRKTRTDPPRRGGQEAKIRLSIDEPESLYLDGVWVSPGEEAWVSRERAGELVRAGKAERVE